MLGAEELFQSYSKSGGNVSILQMRLGCLGRKELADINSYNVKPPARSFLLQPVMVKVGSLNKM